jgi:hypothetical protein
MNVKAALSKKSLNECMVICKNCTESFFSRINYWWWWWWGNCNRALRKEPSREQQRKPGLPESVNGSSGKESHGHEHDTEQNTECRQQLEGMHYIFEWRQIIACSIPSWAEREAASYVLFLWREEGSISTFEWWFHQSLLKKLYVGSCSQDKYILQYIIFYFQQKTMPY